MRLANLTMKDFLVIYNTKYIPDHGDVYITYDAVALQLVIPDTATESPWLNNSLTGVPFSDLTSPWVPVTLGMVGMPHVPKFPLASSVYVNFNTTSFPFPLSYNNLPYLEVSNWISIDNYSDLDTSFNHGVPPVHVWSIESVVLRDGSKVQVILSYMLVVILCNALKVVVMWHLWRRSHVEYFTTTGDAVQSFLQRPDRSTIGMCMETRHSLVDLMKTEQNRRTAHMTVQYQRQDHGNLVCFKRSNDSWLAQSHDIEAEIRRERILRKPKALEPRAWETRTRINFAIPFAGDDSGEWLKQVKGLLL